MEPIHIPSEWDDRALIHFEEFCTIMHLPPRTARDWRRRRVGPDWHKPRGGGRIYVTVGDVRRFLGLTDDDSKEEEEEEPRG